MSVHILDPPALQSHLQELRELLCGLPSTLPQGTRHYNFKGFVPDPEKVEDYGSVEAAVNQALEVIFCPQGRQAGPIILKERGDGLTAVADVLHKYTEEFPLTAILQKWTLDLISAARHAGAQRVLPGNTSLSRPVASNAVASKAQKKKDTGAKNSLKRSADKPDTSKKPSKKKQKVASNVMDDYVDAERDEPRGPGGVIPCPILDDVSIFTALKDDPEKRFWRCVGAVNGCTTTWVIPRVKGRVLKHAATCRYISADLQQKVNEELGDDAPGARVARNALNQSVSQSAVPAAHGTIQSAGGSQPSVYEMSKSAWYEMLDYEILKFMCRSGMPPHVLNLKEWKSMWACAVPKYKPVSGSTMEDTQVPREAARIRVLALQYLQTCERLTISFDGGTTRRPQSVYTMHVTTEDKKFFLWAGDEASAESHTADHIYQILKAVIDIIGPHRFRGISSDNTGNTTGARNRIHSDYPWILILPDPCHRLNLLCNDICKIPYFKPHIKNLRRTVKYFKKSTFASAHLRIRRKKLKIRRGLKSIGKTRFGTIYHSGESLRQCSPAIRELCVEKVIEIPDVNNLFLPTLAATQFACGLEQLTTVLAPIAKSITCLEATHANVGDVYQFWLACTASIYDIISTDGLDTSVKESIRSAVNYRFNQMVNEAPCDVYLTGFILDPRFKDANIMRDLNPLAIQKIKIGGSSAQSSTADLPETLRRVGRYLLKLLRVEYEQQNFQIAKLSAPEAVDRCKEQVQKYIKGVYPFNVPFRENDTAIGWWTRLDNDKSNDPQPLAHLARNLLSVTPNSMADERTGSTFTWLNSAHRNRQEVATLVRLTQIRQWNMMNEDKDESPPFRPAVKFRDLEKTVRNMVATKGKQGAKVRDERSESRRSDTSDSSDREESGEESGDEGQNSDEEGDDESDEIYLTNGEAFEVDQVVNLKARALLDVLADHELEPSKKVGKDAPLTRNQGSSTTANMRTLRDDDWDM